MTALILADEFEYHISLHHSQTMQGVCRVNCSLNTIYLYIILKHFFSHINSCVGLNTIYLYIILKPLPFCL